MAEPVNIRVRVTGGKAGAREVEGVRRGLGGLNRANRDLVRSQGRLRTAFGTVYGRGGALFAAAGGLYGAQRAARTFIGTASDINESLSKNRVLFGDSAKGVEDFSSRSAKAFGISKASALEYTGVFGNLFRALGVNRREAAKNSVGLTKLAADMASFNNTSIDDALEAIRSGLVGEVEPLRRFGVNLNDAQLRQEALRLGLVKTTKNVLTPYQRSMAAQALITKQTAAAHGDFHRTAGGLANQLRILQARASDVGARIGQVLLPYALKATTALNRLIRQTENGRGPLIDLRNRVRSVARAIGNVIGYFRRHRTQATLLIAVVGALAAGLVAYRLVVGTIIRVTRAWIVVQAAIDALLTANPIGIAIAALAALAVGFVVAYKRSATFRRIVQGALKAVAIYTWPARKALEGIYTVLKNIISAASQVAGALGKVPGLKAAGGLLKKISPFANGGVTQHGGLSLVGERGPEIAQFPGGTRITPLPLTAAAGGMTVVHADVILDGKKVGRSRSTLAGIAGGLADQRSFA